MRSAMDVIAPMKVVNRRKEWEPWKEDAQIKVQWAMENSLWQQYKSFPTSQNKS